MDSGYVNKVDDNQQKKNKGMYMNRKDKMIDVIFFSLQVNKLQEKGNKRQEKKHHLWNVMKKMLLPVGNKTFHSLFFSFNDSV